MVSYRFSLEPILWGSYRGSREPTSRESMGHLSGTSQKDLEDLSQCFDIFLATKDRQKNTSKSSSFIRIRAFFCVHYMYIYIYTYRHNSGIIMHVINQCILHIIIYYYYMLLLLLSLLLSLLFLLYIACKTREFWYNPRIQPVFASRGQAFKPHIGRSLAFKRWCPMVRWFITID